MGQQSGPLFGFAVQLRREGKVGRTRERRQRTYLCATTILEDKPPELEDVDVLACQSKEAVLVWGDLDRVPMGMGGIVVGRVGYACEGRRQRSVARGHDASETHEKVASPLSERSGDRLLGRRGGSAGGILVGRERAVGDDAVLVWKLEGGMGSGIVCETGNRVGGERGSGRVGGGGGGIEKGRRDGRGEMERGTAVCRDSGHVRDIQGGELFGGGGGIEIEEVGGAVELVLVRELVLAGDTEAAGILRAGKGVSSGQADERED